ncbi:protein DpdD [Micromonospora sp. NPDC048930]|uniref:protein DpdD n=1 Tax=Micromonospora sp. NPDC048930 TaxID=3364261 RepID=UPI00371BB846
MSERATGAPVIRRWESFQGTFFALPNELRVGAVRQLDELVTIAQQLVAQDPPKPVVLPARIDGSTHYFAMAFSAEQSRTLRELLQSHIGKTWTDFEGQSLAARPTGDLLERAAIALAGDSRYVYRFRVADTPPAARIEVRESVQALLTSIAGAPRRHARLSLPIGRLIGELADACAAGAEQESAAAYAVLASDHRLSRANRMFLQIQVLAAFERWDELDEHPELDTLLKLPRPSLASDALARLAMSKLPDPPDLAAFGAVATRFNALIDSVSTIRSAAGARYYTLWALTAGESPEMVRERLTRAGWTSDPGIVAVLDAQPTASRTDDAEKAASSVTQLRHRAHESIEAGRFDAAVDLLSRIPTDVVDLPAVVEAVSHTLTAAALALLARHRAAHGDEAIRRAFGPAPRVDRQIEPMTLPDRIVDLFSASATPQRLSELAESIAQTGVSELRAPGGTDAAGLAIQKITAGDGPGRLSPGLDVCIDLVRDLKSSNATVDDVRSLSYRVLELWAYHDDSGDRHRMSRIVQLVDGLVAIGLSVQAFDEVVELLRAGWDPFLTDADVPLGLDLLEHLLAHRAGTTDSLDKFAVPMLSRIGLHNAGRIPSAALAVAVDLAPSFGLTVTVPPAERIVGEQPGTIRPGTRIALYSLQEQALERAARILRSRHPGLEVLVCADHVATDSLRAAARAVDLFVVMDRAAAHAATTALKAERPARPIRYAAGKGSTSLIEAAEEWLSNDATTVGDLRPDDVH